MPLQVTRAGTRVRAGELSGARERFERQHCVLISGFFDADVLARLVPLIDAAPFAPRVHERVDPPPVDSCLADQAVLGRLLFLLNDPALFDAVRAIAGCDPIGFYEGTVYRMLPSAGHFDSWHDDFDGNRMVALSVNLGREAYEGGVLRIRHKGGREPLHQVHNTGFGDAIVFRLAEDLEHCLTDVTGRVAKTALAGWFQRTPAYVRNVRGAGRPV